MKSRFPASAMGDGPLDVTTQAQDREKLEEWDEYRALIIISE